MTTLRKLPTIAPNAKAKNDSRENIRCDCTGMKNFEFRISNEEFRIRNSSFEILHSPFSVTVRASDAWGRMGSGGLRGLQNRCFGAEASKGWFDSVTPPPSRCCVLEVGGAERDRTVDLLN